MSMDGIIQQMIILFILMFVGFLISKAKVITAEANQYICKMVVTIGVPGLLLSSVADGSPFHDQVELLEVIGVCTLINVAVVLISWLVVKVLRIQNSKNVYKFMTIFPNAGFIGFPVINAIFGSEALIYAAIFQLPHNLLMYTYGIYLMSGGSKNEIDLKKLINPCVVAALAAILFCVFDIKLSFNKIQQTIRDCPRYLKILKPNLWKYKTFYITLRRQYLVLDFCSPFPFW